MRKYIFVILQVMAGYGFCLNMMWDAGEGHFVSASLALFVALLFFMWAIRTLEYVIVGGKYE